jgi:hypothetical protein
MANKIKLEFLLVGGPHDGRNLTYEGESSLSQDEVFNECEKLELEGHKYRIVDRDFESKLLTLMY